MLGTLLFESTTRDRRERRLTKRLLKEIGYPAPIMSYLKFFRSVRAEFDSQRFQLIPESKMGARYFKIDQVVLKDL